MMILITTQRTFPFTSTSEEPVIPASDHTMLLVLELEAYGGYYDFTITITLNVVVG